MSLDERELVPAAKSSPSSRATVSPRAEASRATPAPVIPPPTMTRSNLVASSSSSRAPRDEGVSVGGVRWRSRHTDCLVAIAFLGYGRCVTVLLIVLAVLAVLAAATVGGARYALGRRNRVVQGVKSPAPLLWLTSGRREAKLHRRLRQCGRRLALVPPADDVADIITRLRVELAELDAHLVVISRRPSAVRRADRGAVTDQIKQLEALVRRVEERTRDERVSLDELDERLDLLEAADNELTELLPPEN